MHSIKKQNSVVGLLFVFIVTLGSISSVMADDDPITVFVSEYPPFIFQKGSTYTGLELDMMRAILKDMQVPYTYMPLPWERALRSLKTGRLDLMCSLTRTKEREEFIDFIGITRYEQMVLIVRKEDISMPIKSINDFKKYKKNFGIERGAYYPRLSEKLEADKELMKCFEIVHDNLLNYSKTSRGRILGFFEDRLNAVYLIKKNTYSKLVIHSYALSEPSAVWIGASRKMGIEKRSKLKASYSKLKRNGTIDGILDKWLN